MSRPPIIARSGIKSAANSPTAALSSAVSSATAIRAVPPPRRDGSSTRLLATGTVGDWLDRAADLAHGLRTPLQVIHAEIERLREGGHRTLASNLQSATETMQRNVERELARVRLADPLKDAAANVSIAIDQVLRVIQRTPDGQRLDWVVDVPKDMTARIDRDDLSEAIGNLVENATRHASHAVSITCAAEDKYIALSVTDDGAGIPEDRVAEALARGARLDERSPGHGLGNLLKGTTGIGRTLRNLRHPSRL